MNLATAAPTAATQAVITTLAKPFKLLNTIIALAKFGLANKSVIFLRKIVK